MSSITMTNHGYVPDKVKYIHEETGTVQDNPYFIFNDEIGTDTDGIPYIKNEN